MKFRSTTWRIAVGALLPLVIALVAQATYSLVGQREAMDQGLDAKARSLATLVVGVAGPGMAFDDAKDVAAALDLAVGDRDFAFASVRKLDGQVVAERGDASPLARATFDTRAGQDLQRVDGMSLVASPVTGDGQHLGTLYLGLRNEHVHAQATANAIRPAVISLLGIAIAIAVVGFLARKIGARNRQMRVVLDNVDEALVTIHESGALDDECSAAFVAWFGEPRGAHFADKLAGGDAKLREQLRVAWSDLVERVMPLDLLVMQFPTRIERDGKHLRLDIKPLFAGKAFTGALLRVRDVTAEVEAQNTLEAQREYVAVVERALADPTSVSDFIEDTESWIERLVGGELDASEGRRAVHTIKGNAAVFGVTSVADAAHRLEDELTAVTEVDRAAARELIASWGTFASRVEKLMSSARGHVHVSHGEVEALATLAECAGATAAARLRRLLMESVGARLHGLAPRIERAAQTVCKPVPEVHVTAADVWLPPERLRGFWDVLNHVVRNAMDHGIEDAFEREAAGKPEAGRIDLVARVADELLVIEVTDDGRGVPWDRVRDKAIAAGLPHATREDLERAVFSETLSTAEAVTTTSGRGIGLSAVESVTRGLGGRVAIASEPGRGTTLRFTFPLVVPAVSRRPTRPSKHPAFHENLS